LVTGCREALKECNVKDENIFETTVPGSFELPLAARFLALSGTVDAIVAAGVLIKGEVSSVIDLNRVFYNYIDACAYVVSGEVLRSHQSPTFCLL
jgi:hypothetical protein